MELPDLIIDALDLQGVRIESFEADKAKLKLDIWVRQNREDCSCAKCRGPLHAVKDCRERELRGPPIGAHREVVIHFLRLRAVC